MQLFIFLAKVAAESLRRGANTLIDWAQRGDRELVDAIVGGDHQAFSWLVKKHWGSMVRVATSLLRNEQVAQEVVQETWETVFKEISKFRGEAALKNWVFKILVNRAKRVGQREARTIAFSSLSVKSDSEDRRDLTDEFTSKGKWKSPVHGWRMIDPQNEAINREGLRILERALNHLPESQKVVVTMRDLEGLDAAETCEMLDISEGNQRVLLHRGRTALRLALEAAEQEPMDRELA